MLSTAGINPLEFPVLCITPEGFLTAAEDSGRLETCSAPALKGGFYKDLLLVDAAGQSWTVRKAEKIAGVPPLWGWRLSWSREIRVRLDIIKDKPFDLAKFKDRVCRAIDQFPDQWGSASDGSDDIDVMQARVRAASDMPALIRMFLSY
jgi:hypothetical protein